MNTKLCEICNTRPIDPDTQGASFSTMCTPCYEYAGWENTHTDENHSSTKVDPQCPVCLGDDPAEKPMDNTTALRPKGRCNCSNDCIGTTGKIFSQGHDARLVTRLVESVIAQQQTAPEAEKELLQRGGSGLLLSKFNAALDRAAQQALAKVNRRLAKLSGDNPQPKPAAPKAKKAKVDNESRFTVDGFELYQRVVASEPDVHAKVGRWPYTGNVTEHRMVDGDKADTVVVFRYTNKSGEKVVTTRFVQIATSN